MQVGIIVVAFSVKGTDTHPPAAIAVPAHGLHHAPFHRHDGGAQGAHQIVSQVLALEAEGTGGTKIVAMAVAVTGGDGRKGFEAVLGKLLPILLNGKAAHQAPVGTGIGFQIVVVIFGQASQKLLDFPVAPQILRRFFYGGGCAFSAGTAGRQGKDLGK